MNQMRTLVILLVLALALVACGPAVPPAIEPDVERDESPSAPAADVSELVAGNAAFAFDLYHVLGDAQGNLFYSPYSISIALGMTSLGARGETLDQMEAALHFSLPQERLHPAVNALDLELAARPAQAEEAGAETPFEFSSVNALWGQQGYPFRQEFIDGLALHYGAGLRLADFVAAAEQARQAINDWVEAQTRDRIKQLIPEGTLNADTRLVLVNAVYFKAGWMHTFSETGTADAPFTLLDGSQAQVPMMAMSEPVSLAYASGDGFQAFALPYEGGGAEMVVILPEAGRFAEVESTLGADMFAALLAGMDARVIALRMPKFSFTTQAELTNVLTALGMTDAFTAGLADFSGMDGSRDLYISAVLHKAFVAVDEQGTEAAAATAVIVSRASLVLPDLEITVDRPFIFVIRDVPTGTVLFVGRVLQP